MLRATILGLGVGTLCVTIAMVHANEPPDRVPEPRPKYLALGGVWPDLAAEQHGPGCFAPMLDELQRHPHWSIRLDHLEWNDYGDDEHHASLVIDGETGTWRDTTLPQSLTLTAEERREVLAAFARDCRVDESLPYGGYSGDYIGVAFGESGPVAAKFPFNSHVAVRLVELFERFRDRHIAGRADDLRGFSLELTAILPGQDDEGRPIRQRHRIVLGERDLVERYDLHNRVHLLDWAMARATSLPAGDGIFRGTLRAHGTSRPIAVDLEAETWHSGRYRILRDLSHWAKIEPVQ